MRLDRRLIGLTALNQFSNFNASARGTMFLGQFSQCIVLKNPEVILVLSGLEGEMTKLLLNIDIPNNVKVLELLAKYPPNAPDFPEPEDAMFIDIFFLDLDTMTFGYRHVTHFDTYDKKFGFNHKWTNEFKNVSKGDVIPANTKLTRTDSEQMDGVFAYGVNLNVLPISRQETAEDAMIISESAAEKLTYYTYSNHMISVGGKKVPLNAHGDTETYKVFPDYGEQVGDDGILMAIRDVSKENEMFLILNNEEIDPTFDDVYPLECSDGVIVDIDVLYTPKNKDHIKLTTVYDQIEAYSEASKSHREEFVAIVAKLLEEYSASATIDNDLHIQTVNYLKLNSPKIVNKYKQADMSTYTLNITVRYEHKVGEGNKATNRHGGKGIVATVIPDDQMPIDANGLRAELLIDPKTTPSRMNLGSKYEGYMMSVVQIAGRTIKEMIDSKPQRTLQEKAEHCQDVFQYIVDLVKIIRPEDYDKYMSLNKRAIVKTIISIYNTGFHATYSIDDDKTAKEVCLDLMASKYALKEDYVMIPTGDGKMVKSYGKAYVETQYIFLPNKDATSWLSVASAYLNVKSVPVAPSRQQRDKLPWNATPVKIVSETEGRFIPYYCGPSAIAELRDRALNNDTLLEIYKNILEADNPTSVDSLVDREKIPLGNENVLKLTESLFSTMGIGIDIDLNEEN